MREIVYMVHISNQYILQTMCRPALDLLPYMEVRSVLTLRGKRKYQIF